jgi:hypothetical protein
MEATTGNQAEHIERRDQNDDICRPVLDLNP